MIKEKNLGIDQTNMVEEQILKIKIEQAKFNIEVAVKKLVRLRKYKTAINFCNNYGGDYPGETQDYRNALIVLINKKLK